MSADAANHFITLSNSHIGLYCPLPVSLLCLGVFSCMLCACMGMYCSKSLYLLSSNY